MNLPDKHVCYSRQLGCSLVSPCSLCFQAVCANVLPIISRSFALTHEQATHLRYVFEEAYARFSQYALHDPELVAGAIDLRRLVVSSDSEHARPGHFFGGRVEETPPPVPAPWGSYPASPYPPQHPAAAAPSFGGYAPPQAQDHFAPPPAQFGAPGPYVAPPGPYVAPPGPYAAPAPYATPPQPQHFAAPTAQQPALPQPLARAPQAAWPTRAAARPAAPAAPPEPPPSPFEGLDQATLDMLGDIGDALARGETPELPPGFDVGKIVAAFVPPGTDPASLDIGALVASFVPQGTDVSAIVAMVSQYTRSGPPTIDVAGVDVTDDVPSESYAPKPLARVARAAPAPTPSTPEHRAARREERRRAERAELRPTAPSPSPSPAASPRAPAPAPAPTPTELSADDFAGAGSVITDVTPQESAPNGVAKPSAVPGAR